MGKGVGVTVQHIISRQWHQKGVEQVAKLKQKIFEGATIPAALKEDRGLGDFLRL